MPTIWQSMIGLHSESSINALFIFLPISWTIDLAMKDEGGHKFSASTRFALSLIAILPLQKRFEWLGEEMIPYIGAELGDLLTITLSNAVEASLSVGLLIRNNYRLLQITGVGVILLHILFVPGVTFFLGGAHIIEQELHSGKTQINHTLLTLGVMALVVPTAFFAALDRGNLRDLTLLVTHLNVSEAATEAEEEQAIGHPEIGPLLTDARRGQFLQLSRGIAFLLLVCYIGARMYMHNPPGKGNALTMYRAETAPSRLRELSLKKESRDSRINPWFGVYAILQCVALMAVTAQFLVSASEELLQKTAISEEWFGIFLLPLISFAGDAFLSLENWCKKSFSRHRSKDEDSVDRKSVV